MPLSRREFALTLAAVSTTAITIAADDLAQPERPDPVRREAAAWLELILVRYPDTHLTPEVLSLVAGDVLGDILHTRRISSFPLRNGDAPAGSATAWRKPD